MDQIAGNGNDLFVKRDHPYINRQSLLSDTQRNEIIHELNIGRDNSRKNPVEVTYYFEVKNDQDSAPNGLARTAKQLLEHGTIKQWADEGKRNVRKPRDYNEYMSFAIDIQLLGYNKIRGIESGIIKIGYPCLFFDKRLDGQIPLAQLMTAIAGEPYSGFSFYIGARIIEIEFPEVLLKRFPGQKWPHKRIRQYLGLNADELLLGSIVKPKTGLTPKLFSESVVEAALAGVHFVKSDENFHLTQKGLSLFVKRVTRDLRHAGFDLDNNPANKGRRFLFAPHITTDYDNLHSYAETAIESGANALMFSPYHSGGFLQLAAIVQSFDVPVYAHTAGMNVLTGSTSWGFDPRVTYFLSAAFGAAFMHFPAAKGYLKPDEAEREQVLTYLRKHNLEGENGMTLSISGGLGARNLGFNIQQVGQMGRMFLAGTAIYSHPDGPSAGVNSLILAYEAYKNEKITTVDKLRDYANRLGDRGKILLRAL